MKKLAVIVTEREEPHLAKTVECVRKAASLASAPEIVVVQDGGRNRRNLGKLLGPRDGHHLPWPEFVGCQAARDFGIMAAKADAVCVVDAHMDFQDGLWDDMLQRLDDMDGVGVVGCGCGGLEPREWRRMDDARYFAYPVAWAGFRPIQLKWNYAKRPVPQAFGAMGACYMFAKEWYADALLRPWRFGTGWGQDEECLTVANFLAGGGVAVSELVAWHWFRSQKELPYTAAGVGMYGQIANAMRLWDMFPPEHDAAYDAAMAMLAKDKLAVIRTRQIQAIRDRQAEEVAAYADAFAALHPDRSMDDFLARCVTLAAYEAIDSSKPSLPPFRMPPETEPVKPRRRGAKRAKGAILMESDGGECRRCGARTRRTHVYPNGNALMECVRCGRKAIEKAKRG